MSRTISTNNYTAGLTLTNTGDSPVYIAQGVSVTNAGGVALAAGAGFYWSVTNAANAQIGGLSFGVSLTGAGTAVNLGTMSASYTAGSGFYYNSTNHSLMVLSAGVYVGGGGVSNSQSGLITGEIGVGVGGGGSLVNAGAIKGTLVSGKGFGVALTDGGTVTNLTGGTISAGYFGVISEGAATVSNQSGATITGSVRGVFVLNGIGSVVNQGSIGGNVYGAQLALGGTLSNASGATISAGYDGVLVTGAAGTVTNLGLISAVTVAGVDMIAGGSVSNQGTIDAADYGVLIKGAAGTVTNQGVISGTTYAGVMLPNGGTVTNQTGGDISADDNGLMIKTIAGTVSNQGTITGTTVGGVYLVAGGGVSNLSGGSIAGGFGGVIVAGGTGSIYNQGVIRQLGTTPQSFAVGGILDLAGGSVNNAGGTIVGYAYGVDVANGAGSVTNSGLITNARASGGAGVILVTSGSVNNTSTIASQGYSVEILQGTGTVTNSGLIASYLQGGGAGVALEAGGSVTNSGTGDIAGEWIGVQTGVFGSTVAGAAATIDNSGRITAADGQGDGAAVWIHGPGVLINRASGVIQGSTNGTVTGGPMNGLAVGGFGVVAYYQTTVINYGSIGGGTYSSAAYASGTKGPKQFAFDASNRNASNTYANLIEMSPGASFGGVVKATDGVGLATLELKSGASTGTIISFGSVTVSGIYYHGYLGFGAVKIDNGARWSLGGTVASGVSIAFAGTGALMLTNPTAMQGTITGFGTGDTIGLSGVTVTGSSFSGGVLTLTAASGAVTLAVPGTFSASQLVVANGTAGATVALLATQDRTLSWSGAGGNAAFGSAANWNDLTNNLSPAQTAPGATDQVDFDSSNGAVIGTGTVASVDVGTTGNGVLQISTGTIVTGTLDAGIVAAADGQIGLTGAGTELMVTGSATVADDGTGVLSVLSGATFAAQSLTIGSLADSSGALVVSGSGSLLSISGQLNIGTALGTGDLTVGPGAVVDAAVVNLQGGVVLEGGLLDPTVYIENGGSTTGGFGTVASDFILLEGTILSNGSKSGKQTEVVQGTLVGGGTADIKGSVSVNGPGILQIGTHDTIELSGAVLNAATTTFTDNLTPTGTYTVNNSVIDVVFQDTTGVLVLDDIAGFAGTVATWKAGDSFVITGGTLSNAGVSNGNTLTFADAGTGAGAGGIDTIIFGSAISAGGFNIVNGNTVQALACFAEGTRIGTARGEVPVEALSVGDRVLTHRAELKEIVWLGQRAVDCRHHIDPATVCPIRVQAGAFGPAMPARDLWLSPDHAVFVEDVLVPIHCLINGGTIRQMVVPAVTYYHVELPEHDVILAENLPVESYLDSGDRENFGNGGGAIRLFPDFTARMWEMSGCAPLIKVGPTLERIKRALARNKVVVASRA